MSKKQIYKYKDYVDIEGILISKEQGYRYSLFIPFKEARNNKYVIVIMKNPSEANKTISDKSINNVLNFCYNKYDGVYIANLYPYCTSNPNNLKYFIELESYGEKMKKNLQVLDTLLKKTDEVIVAWGTSSKGKKCEQSYKSITKILSDKLSETKKKVYAMRFISSKNPWHPRNWEEGFNLELYELKKIVR
ncbi:MULTISPECIES: DUF1643 domain-containing protein [Clostridium]|uniref:DUF1643 domain-containing protein n=2 Tax=Clostridium TaxID=1485 RepID=A0A1A6B369_9CLOT|nr:MULTISPECIES: DUF1643 domain-containing protein [Clostridium]OBR96723.1 hypothetical protein CLRAG_02310 [Clostridium ragsdalei P11]QXE18282.1 hypothetical protein B5S50_05210 [Clostridium sp. 001]RMC96029.1 DUF1643 domain-containing protein [Clostridium autoethanogenum]